MSGRKKRLGLLDSVLAALAVVLGGGSLVLFAAFLFGVDLHVARLARGEGLQLVLDAGLCLLFFAQHSLMLRRSFGTRLSRVLEPRRHGAVYAVTAGLALASLVLLWQPTDTLLYAVTGTGRWILHGIQLLALASVLWGWRALGGFDPFGVTPLYGSAEETAPPLTVRGPYQWVRHPLYLAFVIVAWATPVLTTDRLLFNVLSSAWIVVGCLLEERDLVATYGDAYRTYQRRTPMLLPWRVPR